MAADKPALVEISTKPTAASMGIAYINGQGYLFDDDGAALTFEPFGSHPRAGEVYTVQAGRMKCNCPDAVRRPRPNGCKHVQAAGAYLRQCW